MAIGTRYPVEWKNWEDPETGRTIRQFTSSPANNYPLYYFIPSLTPGEDRLVFHSERTGSLQLFSLETDSGEIVQLTDGRTPDSNWKIWCRRTITGIYDHLAVLNGPRREVIHFEGPLIHSTHLDTLEGKCLHNLGDRLCISQNAVSPDGSCIAFVHTDRHRFLDSLPTHDWTRHQAWRNSIPCTISLLDLDRGHLQDVAQLGFHVHHVIFIDDRTLLINHVQNDTGMWTLDLKDGSTRILRPRDENGSVVHQVVTRRGIFYEAVVHHKHGRRSTFGLYDLHTNQFVECGLPFDGYVHVGFDPAGEVTFFEHHGESHQLIRVHDFGQPTRQRLEVLRTMAPYPPDRPGQCSHAHPFMARSRNVLYYTEVIDGNSQVCALRTAEPFETAEQPRPSPRDNRSCLP